MIIPSKLIKDLLVAASLGVFASTNQNDWSINISKQPDAPDKSITVYDTGGLASNPRWLLDYPSVQILVRGSENSYEVTYNKTVQILNALLGYPSTTFGTDRLVMIIQLGNIAFLGYDKKNRPEISINFGLTIEPGTTGSYRDPI